MGISAELPAVPNLSNLIDIVNMETFDTNLKKPNFYSFQNQNTGTLSVQKVMNNLILYIARAIMTSTLNYLDMLATLWLTESYQ